MSSVKSKFFFSMPTSITRRCTLVLCIVQLNAMEIDQKEKTNLSSVLSPNNKYEADLNNAGHIKLFDIRHQRWRSLIYEGKEKEDMHTPQLQFITDDILCSWVQRRTKKGLSLRIRLHYIEPLTYEECQFPGYPYCETREFLIADATFAAAFPSKKQLLIKKKNELVFIDYEGNAIKKFEE
ncbi:hypothetical protein HYX58_01095 [Candidatus Dependentiae bacterium]|nr:hypothetical protein [Candidatus Dependentiae bacterium]